MAADKLWPWQLCLPKLPKAAPSCHPHSRWHLPLPPRPPRPPCAPIHCCTLLGNSEFLWIWNRGWQTFSIRCQIVNILSFSGQPCFCYSCLTLQWEHKSSQQQYLDEQAWSGSHEPVSVYAGMWVSNNAHVPQNILLLLVCPNHGEV